MKLLNKNLKKNKKSIISFALASILSLSFNYTPLAILSNDIREAAAYKSSSTQTYYTSSTTNEANFGNPDFPASLLSYFENSGKNFNISTYYKNRFEKIYGTEFDNFLRGDAVNDFIPNYESNLDDYLSFVSRNNIKYESLYEYYLAASATINTNLKISSFRDYAEYFVSHPTTWTDSSHNEHTISAIFPVEDDDYRSKFYKQFADFYDPDGNIIGIPTDDQGNYDGLTDTSDFHTDSLTYNRFKTLVDNYIEKTVAIYHYNDETQNKVVAGILANGAPTSTYYYYDDNLYTTVGTPKVSFQKTQHEGVYKNTVYYFGNQSDLDGKAGYNKNPEDLYNDKYFSVNNDASLLKKDLMFFVPVPYGEFGSVDDDNDATNGTNIITYWRYDATRISELPYLTTDSVYDVYVVDDNVDESEQATYDSLFYKVISQDVIDNDTKGFYVNIPYTPSLTDYFTTISGYTAPTSSSQENRFTRYVDMFTTQTTAGGKTTYKSNLYLKYAENPAKVVYLDTSTGKTAQDVIDAAKASGVTYTHTIVEINMSASDLNLNDYKLIDSGDSTYAVKGFKLYFEKVKVPYTELETKDALYNGFEMVANPIVTYEKTEIPAQSYETDASSKKIYVLSENASEIVNSITYEAVSNDKLNEIANLYIKVPASVAEKLNEGETEPFTFYYKHKTVETNRIYIVDNSENASENKVYKNLHYTVISESEFKDNLDEYSVISSTDSNYNKNFKLYYKYNSSVANEDLFVQNAVRGGNALYIIDDNYKTNASRKSAYKANNFTVISTEEFNANSEFYYQLSEDNDGYNTTYTKLYYKYKPDTNFNPAIYVYSSKTSTEYKTFYNTDSDYVAKDYKLIEPGEYGYKEGSDLYYKRIRTESYIGDEQGEDKVYKNTYYTMTTTNSTVALKANQYYAISFYVYTQGYYDELKTLPVEAAFYMTDTSEVISEIAIDKISTNGTWKKYYAFVATDSLATSAVKFTVCMGNRNSILGSQSSNTSITSVTGSVLFDEITVTLINETDYYKQAIDNKPVQDDELLLKDDEGNEITGKYADHEKYNNEVVVVDKSTHPNLVFDNKTRNNINVWDGNTWDDMFNLDELAAQFDTLTFAPGTDGYSEYLNLWQYYIGRNVSGKGNSYVLSQYQKAYADEKLKASIIDEKDLLDLKKELEEETTKEDDKDKDDDKNQSNTGSSSTTTDTRPDVKYLEETFRNGNKVLKLENQNRIIPLGVTSNTFEIKPLEYYKLVVWVYATNKDAKAVLTLNSVLNTEKTPDHGSLLTATTTVDACVKSYSKEPTNEYGWIPVTFFIQGNTFQTQNVSLVLAADADSTVYFDNITIEKTTASAYSTATNDATTKTLSLAPASSLPDTGVTNGYFHDIDVTNYKEETPELPSAPKSKTWNVETTNSTGVIAGIVPTTLEYTSLPVNFFNTYGATNPLSTSAFKTNVFAIHAPATKSNDYAAAKDEYTATSVYKIYSSAISLEAASVSKISFQFYADSDFTGDMDANLYFGSVDTNKLLANIHIKNADITKNTWNTYTFYVQTTKSTSSGSSGSSVLLEIGVENATGTAYFHKVSKVKETETLQQIRDNLLGADGTDTTNTNEIYSHANFKNVRLVNVGDAMGSIHTSTTNKDTTLYDTKEYSSTLVNTKNHTVGQTGVVVASFYDNSKIEHTYTVTINKVEYYIKEIVDPETGDATYELYSDSYHHEKVEKIDGLPVSVTKEKVVVGTGSNESEYEVIDTKKTIYTYSFANDYTVNNNFISGEELTNNYSENVLILSNSFDTDYLSVSPVYTNALATNKFYVLKIYVKTSEFADNFGLNINIAAVSTTWSNIDTTDMSADKKDQYGFVCYQALITTNSSSVSSLGVTFSIGTEANTGKGYAIIAGVELVPYSTEKLFNEYAAEIPEDDTTAKKYYGKSTTKAEDSSKKEDDATVGWATFFYIFSSLLLGIVLVMALVAVILKKHPIKKAKEAIENDHERTNDFEITTTSGKKSSKKGVIDVTKEVESTSKPVENDDNHNGDEGFI